MKLDFDGNCLNYTLDKMTYILVYLVKNFCSFVPFGYNKIRFISHFFKHVNHFHFEILFIDSN